MAALPGQADACSLFFSSACQFMQGASRGCKVTLIR